MESRATDWVQGNDWLIIGTDGVRENYGIFHVYAWTMTIGMILAILYSLYKFYKKDLPIQSLFIGASIIVPVSLFGASVFGKLNAEGNGVNAGGVGFWGLFAFWNAGMAIHGGVFAGAFVGIVTFTIIGHYNRVSIWTFIDAIIPNILLGQVVGRWGNFFNHELMGAPVKYYGHASNWTSSGGIANYNSIVFNSGQMGSYSILPKWMTINTSAIYTGSGTTIDGVNINYGDVYQMAPIFFYESMLLLLAWLIITFIIPNIGRWIGKKPWRNNRMNVSFKLSFIRFFKFWDKKVVDPLTYTQAWDKGYFKNINLEAKKEYIETRLILKNKKKNSKKEYFLEKKELQKINKKSNNNWIVRNWIMFWFIIKEKFQYSNLVISSKWKDGRALIKANNPEKYWVPKVGIEGAAFFFFWNIIRFILELNRPNDHLFVMYNKTLSLTLIMLTAVIGLLVMIITQIGIPEFTRKTGYLYEKEYFKLADNSIHSKEKQIEPKIKNDKQKSKELKAQEKLKRLEK